jgi:putative ABC transport system permease protein
MEFKEAIKLALQSLWQNKLRTVLTLLGVMIGVASCDCRGDSGERGEHLRDHEVHAVRRGRVHDLAVPGDHHQLEGLRAVSAAQGDPVRRLHLCPRQLQALRAMGAQQTTVAKVTRGTNSVTDPTIRGYTWQMPSLQNLDIAEGRDFAPSDEEHASMVASSGWTFATICFRGSIRWGRNCAWTASRTP